MIMKKSDYAYMVGFLWAYAASVQAQPSSPPNDAQIAAIVVAANAVDIDTGKLARSKAISKEVKEFGQRMVSDHTAVNQQAGALVKKLAVTPEENPTSKSLRDDGARTLKKL
jgi:putative membrane protein